MMSSRNAGAILMLDDEVDIMNIFTLALQQQDFRVIGFTEPILALDHFQKNCHLYWLVVSDIRMPVMDGYQFIENFIESQRNKSFMSAYLNDDIQFNTGSLVKVDE